MSFLSNLSKLYPTLKTSLCKSFQLSYKSKFYPSNYRFSTALPSPKDGFEKDLSDLVRDRLSLITNPVHVITCRGPSSTLAGITVNSVTSLSMNPILLSFNVKLPSQFSIQLHQTNQCSINTLSPCQIPIAQHFSKLGQTNLNLPNEILSSDHIPYLKTSLNSFLCETYKVIQVADHEIWVMKVIDVKQNDGYEKGLLYKNRSYFF